ncbi:MAG: CGGC domain-containing protein [Candidatus Zixiibacteriota bacterium]|nr:MAG: CGGC domain-containing protein [candidate division Zixibacteria bacterium]
MTRIGIIICARYRDCGGGKCFRSLRERQGAFSIYPADEAVDIVGYSTCGGCPGGNVEYVPAEFVKNGCNAIHLATGLVVGYPPCAWIHHFKAFIETQYRVPVVIGTHPIPLKYLETHDRLPFWDQGGMRELAGHLLAESREVMEAYN